MFEFDKYEPKRQGTRTSPKMSYLPFKGGARRSLLIWGEHCIECAAPDCFTSCDLYDARPDERCRRFEYGIFRNAAYPSTYGFGAEVVFRRWGKLEARGNVTMLPAGLCAAMERCILAALPMVNLLGRGARLIGGGIRWAYLAFGALERLNGWLTNQRMPRMRPDAFIAEIYNPDESPAALALTISVDRSRLARNLSADQVPAAFMRGLVTEPGYNRFDILGADFAAVVESGLPFNIALMPTATGGQHFVFLTLDFIVYDRGWAAATGSVKAEPVKTDTRPAAKCVVFDLDNTLWDGVVLERDVTLLPGVYEVIVELDQRGILISVASKNSYDAAMAQIEMFKLDQLLVFPQINWARKSENIAAIANRLSINLDTLVFVDDSPFEREEVAMVHPRVEVLPETALSTLLDHPRLQGSRTDEARQRRALYQAAFKREEVAGAFGSDYVAFLKSCKIVVDLMPLTDQHLDRVIELVQRTNQLNFSGRKYTREEIITILEDDVHDKHVISCADKYGSYGVVGFALTRPMKDGIRVEDFMLSCRVQGKFLEQALFNDLVRRTSPRVGVLEINYVRTDRNGLAEAVLRKLGFPVDDQTSFGRLRRVLGPKDLAVDFLTVRHQTEPTTQPHSSYSNDGSPPRVSAALAMEPLSQPGAQANP